MDQQLFSRFNYLDLLILIVAWRIIYISRRNGLAIELFKLLGILTATYLALHYYVTLALWGQKAFLGSLKLTVVELISFLTLALGGYLGFVALRSIFYRFMKMEANPKINEIGGLILGFLRGFFVVGLLAYILLISNVVYFNNSVKASYLGKRAVDISPATYGWLWENLFSKFFPQEKFNSTVKQVKGEVIKNR